MEQPIAGVWTHADGWIFLSLSGSSAHPRTLVQLLASADGLNHVIPTADELNGALNRLIAAGFVRTRAEKPFVPARVERTFRDFAKRTRRERFKMAFDFVRRVDLPAEVARSITINEDALENAYREYWCAATKFIERGKRRGA